jgi:mono/diheme cytochrome c family protein
MTTNKTILVLIFSLLVSLVLVGCGTQAPSTPVATEAPQSADPQLVSSPEGAPTEMIKPDPTDVPTEAPTEIPTEASADAPAGDVSFASDVMPIIQSRCIRCHGEDRIEEGLVFFTYEDILAGSDNGPVIVPGDVENSLLVELVATKEMPKKGPKLTPPQVQLITDWVAAGALNN